MARKTVMELVDEVVGLVKHLPVKRIMTPKFLEEGDVIDLEEGMVVYAMVVEHPKSRRKYEDAVAIGGDFSELAGRYIVVHAVDETGDDSWPNGHHIFCMRADDPKVKVHFYQSGGFTAEIHPDKIKSLGKAKQTWTLPKKLQVK